MSFLSDSSKLVNKTLLLFSRSKYLGLYFEYDNEKEFLDRINSYLGGCMSFYKGLYLKESFPQINRCSFFFNGNDFFLKAGAAGLSKEENFLKAKAEFLERFSLSFPINDFIDNNLNKVDREWYSKKKLFLRSLLGVKFLRAEYKSVYYGLGSRDKVQATTSGGAGHFNLKQAVVNGWVELIERDAFLVYWLNSISPPKIDLSLLEKNDPKISKITTLLKRYGIKYYFLDTTSDLMVPACVCVLVCDSSTGRKIGLGAGAGFDSESTFVSAACEALINLGDFYQNDPSILLDSEYKPFSDPLLDRKTRMKVYMNDANFDKFKFFISSESFIQVDDFLTISGFLEKKLTLDEQLAHLKNIFRKKLKNRKEYDVFFYKVENRLTKLFGFKVVKVICDALCPLYLNENFADPDHPRLKEFAEYKGVSKNVTINIWPHPFP